MFLPSGNGTWLPRKFRTSAFEWEKHQKILEMEDGPLPCFIAGFDDP
jgi:hypothetical protein